MKRIIYTFLLAVVALSCSIHGGVPDDENVDAVVILSGGREKLQCDWNLLSDNVAIIRLKFNGTELDVPVTRKSGMKVFQNVPEGSYDVSVSYLTSTGYWVDGQGTVVAVYGDGFEASLPNRELELVSLEGAVAKMRFKGQPAEGEVAVELSYLSVSGSNRSMTIDTSGGNSDFIINDLGGDIVWKTVYMPSNITEDIFHSPEGLYEKQGGVTPENYCKTVDGYKGIWFSIGQTASSYGPKYSGGLGTYTMKHIPMAIYAPEVNRTYFVYGGCPDTKQAYLLCMIGCYDHNTGMLQKPRVVFDKGGVSDPHDDPTVQIDKDGYIWVFVAGRGNTRPGIRLKSACPYDITAFEYVNESIMAYPQVMYHKDKGFFLFETRYDGTRQLFFQKSPDGVNWTDYKQLASIKEGSEKNSGHYQISNIYGTKLCTAFNRHINGDVDTRTNFYFLQSEDWGETWTTVSGEKVDIPVVKRYSNCLVHDYQTEGRNCYIKDVNFDTDGNPIVIMVTSDNHLTGPSGGVREWHVWYWDGAKWNDSLLTTSTHCYDSGSLWVKGDEWTVVAPTEAGPQYWGAGGEVVMWKSTDHGRTWTRQLQMTRNSERNHTYMRRPFNASDGFYSFWADGNPNEKSISYLYFCNSSGQVWQMPYDMTEEWAAPVKYN